MMVSASSVRASWPTGDGQSSPAGTSFIAFPPGSQVVAAADQVEPGPFGRHGLVEQFARAEPLVPKRYPVRHLVRLALTGPHHGPHRIHEAHYGSSLLFWQAEAVAVAPVQVMDDGREAGLVGGLAEIWRRFARVGVTTSSWPAVECASDPRPGPGSRRRPTAGIPLVPGRTPADWVVVNQPMVRRKPSSSVIAGRQPRRRRARVVSGRRTAGSSTGRGMNSIGEALPVMSLIVSASRSTVSSREPPILTGPAKSLAARAKIPATVSST